MGVVKICSTVPEQKPHAAEAISNAAESHIWLAIYKQKVRRIGKQAEQSKAKQRVCKSPPN